jgi:hypothetical protein
MEGLVSGPRRIVRYGRTVRNAGKPGGRGRREAGAGWRAPGDGPRARPSPGSGRAAARRRGPPPEARTERARHSTRRRSRNPPRGRASRAGKAGGPVRGRPVRARSMPARGGRKRWGARLPPSPSRPGPGPGACKRPRAEGADHDAPCSSCLDDKAEVRPPMSGGRRDRCRRFPHAATPGRPSPLTPRSGRGEAPRAFPGPGGRRGALRPARARPPEGFLRGPGDRSPWRGGR